AMEATIRGLAGTGVRVHIIAVESEKYQAADVPGELRERVSMETVSLDLRVKRLPALMNLIRNRSYHLARFRSPGLQACIRRALALRDYDIVQFETPYLGHYLGLVRQESRALVVLRAHNVEHLIWERLARQERGFFRRAYLAQLSRQLRRYESAFADACDGVAAITPSDAGWFASNCKVPVHVYPYGRDLSHASDISPAQPDDRLFHLGSMNWKPNEEGIAWFLKEVWPLVRRDGRDAELHLAGRHMPDWLRHGQWAGVTVHGEVPDAMAFMEEHGIMIVPLLSGSGLRIKIIEGMEAGRAIVSTTIGAEGIALTDGEHILLADTPGAFAVRIRELMDDADLRAGLGLRARERVRQAYDNAAITAGLMGFYLKMKAGRDSHG
ncbi:MAG TPA: glycosyltransferase family 4 protein, partial [Bacteroidales bacterium]|nr:glycosyltransferase family 4 protein [Bacteroidales bacterium]